VSASPALIDGGRDPDPDLIPGALHEDILGPDRQIELPGSGEEIPLDEVLVVVRRAREPRLLVDRITEGVDVDQHGDELDAEIDRHTDHHEGKKGTEASLSRFAASSHHSTVSRHHGLRRWNIEGGRAGVKRGGYDPVFGRTQAVETVGSTAAAASSARICSTVAPWLL